MVIHVMRLKNVLGGDGFFDQIIKFKDSDQVGLRNNNGQETFRGFNLEGI